MMPEITWTQTHPESAYSSMTGTDCLGNEWRMPASRETVSVRTPDGRHAMGWTAEEAWRYLMADRQAA